MPLKGEAKRRYMREYMRRYMAEYRTRSRNKTALEPHLETDPRHVTTLRECIGCSVSCPLGKGRLFALHDDTAVVKLGNGVHAFHAAQVGLW